MLVLDIDGLAFTFPDRWNASKFDEWSFYRNQFSRQRNDIKAVDAIAVGPDKNAFLIEVKDYRHPETEKPSQLPAAIANKVLYTLAAMLPRHAACVRSSREKLGRQCIEMRVPTGGGAHRTAGPPYSGS